ncbi:MAG: heme ABC transporter permease [Thioalkalispiraceae bacterium]|jgi:heme exporter protein C
MHKLFHQLGSAPTFYRWSGLWLPWLGICCALLFIIGLYGGLVYAPADYQQSDSFRIMYVHVPAAWMSMFVYLVMAFSGAISIIWHIKLAEVIMLSSAPIGAGFTLLALITGSIWGKPMWGTWWEWGDARLVSELLLLFLYIGVIGLYTAIEDKRKSGQAVAILSLVGLVNIPIIHYSVIWLNTLHQGPTVSKFDNPSIDTRMLIPLLIMAVAFKLFYLIVLLLRSRNEILWRERRSQWVKKIIQEQQNG